MKTFILTSNTSSETIAPINLYDDGRCFEFFFSGTFGGGTVTVEQSPDNVNWFTVGDPITAKARVVVAVYSGLRLRVTLTGATNPAVVVFVNGPGN